MAGTYQATATVAPGASVTKGLLYMLAASAVPFRVIALDITMDGGSSQFWPKFQLVKAASGATAPTGGTSLTLLGGTAGGLLQSANTTAKFGTFTAEISGTLTTSKNWFVVNQGGISLSWPYGRDLEFNGGQSFYLQVVTPASFANNIAVNVEIEE